MNATHNMNHGKQKLPLTHPTSVTWIAGLAVAIAIAAYVVWTVWFAAPNILY